MGLRMPCTSCVWCVTKEKTMLHMMMSGAKWGAIPVLLTGAMFTGLAGRYEPLVDFVICMGAMLLLHRAVWLREYFWGTGIVMIGVVFSPLFPVVKIFVLLGFASMVACLTVLAGFR